MQNPRTKYPLIFIGWIILFCAGIMIVKISNSTRSSASPGWLERKLIEKTNDTAIKRLNMSMPSPDMYRSLLRTEADTNTALQLEGLIAYYQQIIQAMPQMADGYSLLGFCYYRQGDKEKAFDMFQKAFYINPAYLYNGVNLSLMFLEANRFEEAIKIVSVTLEQDPRKSMQTIAASKVYQDILGANTSYDPVAALHENYTALGRFIEKFKNAREMSPRAFNLHVRIL